MLKISTTTSLGQPDGGQRIGAQPRDPERIHDAEGGFHRHLEHGRDGQ
jgi:hypothetical protein